MGGTGELFLERALGLGGEGRSKGSLFTVQNQVQVMTHSVHAPRERTWEFEKINVF